MSMILRDFDLPKAGEVLILKIYPDRGVVVSLGTECEARDNIVVPIPKGHGRIIDENEAIENVACFDGIAWLDTAGIKPLLEAED